MTHHCLKERISELDVFRGLSFLAVVFQHSLGFYSRRPDIQAPDAVMIGMVLHFTKFAVPAFVFATGAALFYNHYYKVNYPHFIKKRARDILVPYLIWTFIYVAAIDGIPGLSAAWAKEFAITVLSGSAVYHLWFVVMIFQFYLAYPLLLAFFKRVRPLVTGRWRLAAAIAFTAAAYSLMMWYSYSDVPENAFTAWPEAIRLMFVDYRDRNFLFYFFYFLMGGIAGVALLKWRSFVARSAGWNCFVFTALYIWVGYELLAGAEGGLIDLNCSTPLKPSMFLYTSSEILLIYSISLSIVKNVPALYSVLDFFGRFSYGGYLVHAAVLPAAVKLVNWLAPAGHYLWQSILAFFICALGSVVITALIGMVPYGSLLIGLKRTNIALEIQEKGNLKQRNLS